MNLKETNTALALVQAFDRRTVGEVDVRAWHSVLGDLEVADVMEAIRLHYADNSDWMMPAHVRRGVTQIVEEREAASRATPWAPGQYGVLKAEAMPEVTGPVDESALTPPVRALLAELRARIPAGSRDDLAPRRAYWEREHAAYLRTRDAEPNPLYRPEGAEKRGWLIEHVDGHRSDAPVPGCAFCSTEPSGWRACPPCGGHTRDLPGHMADCHPVHEHDDACGPAPARSSCPARPSYAGYGAEGCDCPTPEKVSESCPLHGLKPQPPYEKMPCRWCRATSGHNVGCHAYGE
jgi:hypothetical protein